jgi:hypothetical protein
VGTHAWFIRGDPPARCGRRGRHEGPHGRAGLWARLRPDPSRIAGPREAAKLALRGLGQRVLALKAEVAALDAELGPLVVGGAPRTIGLLGVSSGHASQPLVGEGLGHRATVGAGAPDVSSRALGVGVMLFEP